MRWMTVRTGRNRVSDMSVNVRTQIWLIGGKCDTNMLLSISTVKV